MTYQDGSMVVDFAEQNLNPPEFDEPFDDIERRTVDLNINEDYDVTIVYDFEIGWELCTVKSVIVHPFGSLAAVGWQAAGMDFDTFRAVVMERFNAEVPEPKIWDQKTWIKS